MSKEIITVVWCDGPLHPDGEQAEATVTHRIATDSVKECEIDLCDDCDKMFARPLLDLLTELGQPVRKGQASPAKVESPTTERRRRNEPFVKCPVEECDWDGMLSAGKQHTPKAHGGEPMAVLEGRYGRRLADGSRVALEYRCPHCEAAFDSRTGRGGHIGRSHG